jgi:uncharacterized protein
LLDLLLQVGQLVFSSVTFAELEARIGLPKFDRYLPIERRRQLPREASAPACWVGIDTLLSACLFCREASDDAFIHAALEAHSVRLVSGDNDLLCPHPLDGLHILSPRAALDELTGVVR